MATEQTDSPSFENEKLKNSGQFKEGNTLGGRKSTGYQSFKDRLQWWLESKTIAEIEQLTRSRTEWKKLSAIDGIVVRRIHAALGKDGGADFVMVLDRLLGKPSQAITGEDGKPLIPTFDLNELARRTAFVMSIAALTLKQQQDAQQLVVIDAKSHSETEKA